MKITIAYWTKPNGKVSINSQRITEVITGNNAKRLYATDRAEKGKSRLLEIFSY